jgi:hypothetical protein
VVLPASSRVAGWAASRKKPREQPLPLVETLRYHTPQGCETFWEKKCLNRESPHFAAAIAGILAEGG